MKCLIIAAGKGTRLAAYKGLPKPLTPVLGLPLIERTILTAVECGIREFYVVTGYAGDKVRAFLDQLASKRKVAITHIINQEWDKENGISVLKARQALEQDFILLMSDHVFEASILRRLMRQPLEDGGVILAVDRGIESNRLVNPEDVSKVLVEDGKILDIGKRIPRYNAYDTGIFKCSPTIFAAVEESVSRGDGSLSGAMNILAKKGKAGAMDVEGAFWIDVDDQLALKRAEKELLSRLQKASDGPVSRYLNRPLSTRITKYIVNKEITPNQISFFSFLLSLIGALLFCLGGQIKLVIGGILAQLSSIIDGSDGEVARLKFLRTDFGGWFDAVLDRYADAFLLFGLTLYVYGLKSSGAVLVLGFLAIIGTFMNSYTADKYDGLMKRKLGPHKHYFRIGRDVRILIIFVGVLLGRPLWVLAVVAFLMNVENVRRILLVYRHG